MKIKGHVIQAVRHQSQKKNTFLVQGARRRRPNAVLCFLLKKIGKQKNIL
jgi:hypothetical protein